MRRFRFNRGNHQVRRPVRRDALTLERLELRRLLVAPVANDDGYELNEDELFYRIAAPGVLENDTDAEGDTFTAVLVDRPSQGNVRLSDDGSFSYSPNRDFFGEDSFTYLARDGEDSNVATVTMTVLPVYDGASAVGDSYLLRPGDSLAVDASSGVLLNDNNPDLADLTVELAETVGGGQLQLQPDGSFVYNALDFAGTTTFQYRVNDGTSTSNPATVTLVVNSAPVGVADEYSVAEDTALTIDSASSILANDVDSLPPNALAATLLEPTTHGELQLRADGTFDYQPETDFFGIDQFSYVASDGFDDSDPVVVTIRVEPANDEPVIGSDTFVALPNTTLTLDTANGVTRNDVDVDGDALIVELVDSTSQGTLQLTPSGGFTYAPNDGFTGVDEFRYRVSDGILQSDVAVVSLVVDPNPVVISEVVAANVTGMVTRTKDTLDGRFGGARLRYDWIELHNPLTVPIDLAGLRLTDADPAADEPDLGWSFPINTQLGPDEYIVVFASGMDVRDPGLDEVGNLHADIRLDVNGDRLAVTQPNGDVLTRFDGVYPAQRSDFSYGLTEQGARYFAEPTPGLPNGEALLGFSGDVTLDQPAGLYDAAFDLAVTAEPDALIRYTLDGTKPTNESALYEGPLTIASTSTIRVAAFRPGYVRSNITTRTFLFPSDIRNQSPNGEIPEGWTDDVRGQRLNYGMDPRITEDPVYGPLLDEGLRQIGSISIVTDLANLIDRREGIYVNAGRSGRDWERETSVELIHPDGTPGFQWDAGLRIRGGFSRVGSNPKHAFRLFFRDDYGDGALQFPLFEEEGADRFSAVDLRTAQNYSWSSGTNDPARNTLLRDVYSRDLQGIQEQAYSRSRYYHLYLNGQYWGIFQTEERPEATHASTYFGGDEDDYDVIKASGGDLEATDGSLDDWFRLWEIAHAGFDNLEQYFFIQGRNPDGSINPDGEVHVQVDRLIDFMINVIFTGNEDMPTSVGSGVRPNNFWAFRNPNTRDGWHFLTHDNEHNMLDVDNDQSRDDLAGGAADSFNPKYLHQQLDEFPEYQLRFADRVQQYFFNDGILTTENAIALLDRRVQQIDKAIVAESARWGDESRDEPMTKATWDAEVDWLRNTFLASRRETVLNQLRFRGLYPEVEAPSLSQHGGEVAENFHLGFAETDQTILYTTDGTDPRQVGGAQNPHALTWRPGSPIVIGRDTVVNARVWDNGQWSALTQASFHVVTDANTGQLRVSEIHFNPADPTAAEINAGYDDNDDFEFIELVNAGTAPIDLSTTRFEFTTDDDDDNVGVQFDFSDSPIQRLEPGGRIVVVEDLKAFEFRYGTDIAVAGQWRGGLSNGGELLTLTTDGQIVQQFAYDDWYDRTDGDGSSLEIINAANSNVLLWGRSLGWQPSAAFGGTPGTASTILGDVNFDGVFNSADLVQVFVTGEYEDNIAGNSSYVEGDWNGDSEFTSFDLVLAFQQGGYRISPAKTGSFDVDMLTDIALAVDKLALEYRL